MCVCTDTAQYVYVTKEGGTSWIYVSEKPLIIGDTPYRVFMISHRIYALD